MFARPSRWIILLYPLLGFGILLPLLAKSNSVLVGQDYTSALHLWGVWWPAQALSHNYDLVYTAYAHYPVPENILALLSLPTSLFYTILHPIFGPYLTYHVLIGLFLTLNATLTYRFIQRHSRSHLIAAMGGLVLTFNPVTWALAAQGDAGTLGAFWLVMALIFTDRLTENPTWLNLMGLVMGVYAALTTSLQFANILLAFWLPYALVRTFTAEKRDATINYMLMASLIMAAGMAIYPLAPFVWSSYIDAYDPGTFVQGIPLTLAATAWTIFSVMLVIGLALGTLLSFRKWLWIVLGLVSLSVFALPELSPLTLLGKLLGVPIPLDFPTIVFVYPAVLAITILLAQGLENRLTAVTNPVRWGVAVVGVVAAAFISGWQATVPDVEVPQYDLYDTIADDPENYAIMAYPFGYESVTSQTQAGDSTYSTLLQAGMFWHGKRIIGGLTTGPEAADATVYALNPLAVIASQQTPFGDQMGIAQQIRETAARWRVGYVLLYDDADTSSISGWMTWSGAFCPVGHEANVTIWRAYWHPAGCPDAVLDIGGASDDLLIGEGWQGRENWSEDLNIRWAGDKETATLSLFVRPEQDYRIILRASSPMIKIQHVTIIVNGQELETFNLTSDWHDYSISVPADMIDTSGLIRLELHHEKLESIDGRMLTAVYDRVVVKPIDIKESE